MFIDQGQGSSVARVPLQLSRNCVVASIQIDLTDDVMRQFRPALLQCVQSTGVTGVILDVSGLEIIDLREFESLRQTMDMVALMGARPVIAGLRPGVVSALIELNANVEGIHAALNLDDAFRLIENLNSVNDITQVEEETDEPGQNTHSDGE